MKPQPEGQDENAGSFMDAAPLQELAAPAINENRGPEMDAPPQELAAPAINGNVDPNLKIDAPPQELAASTIRPGSAPREGLSNRRPSHHLLPSRPASPNVNQPAPVQPYRETPPHTPYPGGRVARPSSSSNRVHPIPFNSVNLVMVDGAGSRVATPEQGHGAPSLIMNGTGQQTPNGLGLHMLLTPDPLNAIISPRPELADEYLQTWCPLHDTNLVCPPLYNAPYNHDNGFHGETGVPPHVPFPEPDFNGAAGFTTGVSPHEPRFPPSSSSTQAPSSPVVSTRNQAARSVPSTPTTTAARTPSFGTHPESTTPTRAAARQSQHLVFEH
eukprot:gnl/Hemi2/2490_TR879_c0_g11_i1.p1 gnl/Hemi2/2490_TR879_c0_g11~~gnl/Hemi2/2490_TR879_c0_g11_i1.p1  ORF type:complete len:329 (-),score=27.17 gnl/Hemi2/2490_TR879_c0_g11_i1:81-1067(-)